MRYEVAQTPFTNLIDNFFNNGFNYGTQPWTDDFKTQNNWATFQVRALENGYEIRGELAGVRKEDLKIEVVDDTLTVSGFRGSKEDKEESFTDYSEFSKAFKLAQGLDREKIEAKFENGFLSLKVPRAESQKRTIALK